MAGIITTIYDDKSAEWEKFQKLFPPLPPPATGEITAVIQVDGEPLVFSYKPEFYGEARRDRHGCLECLGCLRRIRPLSYTYRLSPTLYTNESDRWYAALVMATTDGAFKNQQGPYIPIPQFHATRDVRIIEPCAMAEFLEKNKARAKEAIETLKDVLRVKALFELTLKYLPENCLLRTFINEHAKSNI